MEMHCLKFVRHTMGKAKDLIVKVIPSKLANEFIIKHHYSGKVVQNSQLHFGVFYSNP